MFIAATPYFASRFDDTPFLTSFQSSILAVATLTNLVAMLLLQNKQSSASYPYRINAALLISTSAFTLLTLSTVLWTGVAPALYFVFLLFMVGSSALACGLIQNGAFAFAASFGRTEYMQALMAGQGVAGVLPPVAQVITILLVPDDDDDDDAASGVSGTSAFVYFLTAVLISLVTILAFAPLVRRHNHIIETRMVEHMSSSLHSIEEAERAARKVTSLSRLMAKLPWHAAALFTCFALTMIYPSFTGRILSVSAGPDTSEILQPAAFISIAFLFWNLGDLAGRMASALPIALRHSPRGLFGVSVARFVFVPMYLWTTNLDGRGAGVDSDVWYLLVVQFGFGLTNGWLGSCCMMAAGEWVDEGEREAAGGFMGLCLVTGLAAGSLLSFFV